MWVQSSSFDFKLVSKPVYFILLKLVVLGYSRERKQTHVSCSHYRICSVFRNLSVQRFNWNHVKTGFISVSIFPQAEVSLYWRIYCGSDFFLGWGIGGGVSSYWCVDSDKWKWNVVIDTHHRKQWHLSSAFNPSVTRGQLSGTWWLLDSNLQPYRHKSASLTTRPTTTSMGKKHRDRNRF